MRNPSYIKVLSISNPATDAFLLLENQLRNKAHSAAREKKELRRKNAMALEFWKGLFLSMVLTFKIAGGPTVSAGMWPSTG
jgi:hypothetical protein